MPKTCLWCQHGYIWSVAWTFPICRWLYLHGSRTSTWWRRYGWFSSVKLGTLNITVSGKSSELYLKCLEEVQAISSATLFAPVVRSETVQSMSLSFSEFIRSLLINVLPLLVLVSGWSDNGWLSGGHAVRMAMELCLCSFYMQIYLFKLKSTCSNAQGVAKTFKAYEC